MIKINGVYFQVFLEHVNPVNTSDCNIDCNYKINLDRNQYQNQPSTTSTFFEALTFTMDPLQRFLQYCLMAWCIRFNCKLRSYFGVSCAPAKDVSVLLFETLKANADGNNEHLNHLKTLEKFPSPLWMKPRKTVNSGYWNIWSLLKWR